MKDIVRRMGALPGQRTLIVMSPGFLARTAEAMTDKSEFSTSPRNPP